MEVGSHTVHTHIADVWSASHLKRRLEDWEKVREESRVWIALQRIGNAVLIEKRMSFSHVADLIAHQNTTVRGMKGFALRAIVPISGVQEEKTQQST